MVIQEITPLCKLKGQIPSKRGGDRHKKELDLSSIFSQTNIEEKAETMEAEARKLRQNQIYTFDTLFKDWSANEQFLIDYPALLLYWNLLLSFHP